MGRNTFGTPLAVENRPKSLVSKELRQWRPAPGFLNPLVARGYVEFVLSITLHTATTAVNHKTNQIKGILFSLHTTQKYQSSHGGSCQDHTCKNKYYYNFLDPIK
jgi:hypothetical protein